MKDELKILHEQANDFLVAIDYWTQGHPLAIGIARLKKYLEKPVNSPFPISLTSNPDVVVVGDDYWPTQLLKLKAMSDGWNEVNYETIKAWNRWNAENTGDYSRASDLTVVSMVYRIATQFSNALHNLESAIENGGYGNVEIELSKEWESKLQKDFEHALDWLQRMKLNYRLFAAFESRDYRLGEWSLDAMQTALEREWLVVDKYITIQDKEKASEKQSSASSPQAPEEISLAEQAREVLSGNSLRIFNELAHRKHFVKFDTLQDTVWREKPDTTDAAVVKAIKRMRETLDGKNIAFDITIKEREGRVKLVEMHINQEDK